MICDRCHRPARDAVGVDLGNEGGEFGFCSIACFVCWVRARYMEDAA